MSKLRLKIISVLGPPKRPGVYYAERESAEITLRSARGSIERGKNDWIVQSLLNYKSGKTKFSWHDDGEDEEDSESMLPDRTWYGVVLDEEPELNEFGEVSP